ncbi:hypothetical protein K488DRAFT_28329, partial [Vararia minispora EC-137]
PRVSSPLATSPLADASSARPVQRGAATATSFPRPAQRQSQRASFPTSRPLRPFASISHITTSSDKGKASKPVKLIEPPANHRAQFTLNLTQAELGRQD